MSDYEKHSQRFREAWTVGREQAAIAHIALNDMIRALRKEHNDWSINQITQKIAADHIDVRGFSAKQITRELDNENRKLVQNIRQTRVHTENNNEEPEQSYTPTEDNKQLNEQMDQVEDLEVSKVIEPGPEPDYEAEYKQDKQYEESAQALTNRTLDETSVFDWLKKRDNGISIEYWEHYGIKQWEGALQQFKNRGIKAFKRLYFET
jgi:hypothetical protein